MTRDEFRERVKDVVVELAATGQTGMGFPEEYGGGGDIGASVAAFETLGYGDLSVLVKVGVQFGLFGGAILQLGTKRAPRRLPRRAGEGRDPGLLRDDRDRPRQQRPGTRHDGDVRPGHAGVRHPDRDPGGAPRTTSATPRSTPSSRPSSRSSRSAERATACTRSSYPSATAATVLPGVTITDDGPKMGLNGVDNGRIRFDGVRVPRGRAARPVRRRSPRTASTSARSRTRTAASSPCSARWCRAGSASGAAGISAAKVALTIAVEYGLRRRQFEATEDRRGAAAARLRHAPAAAVPAARAHLRPALRPGGPVRPSCTRCSPASRTTRDPPAPARVPGGRHQGARHLARHADDPGVPRGVRRGRLPGGEPVRRAQGRHRRLHDVRGRQPRAAAAGREGAADRLRQRLRGPRPARHGAVRRGARRRDRARADLRPQAAGAGPGRASAATPGTGRRPARPRLPPGDVPVPRGAHASAASPGG